MTNVVILTGRLTEDVQLSEKEGKKPVGAFTMAVQREYKNSQGEYDTDYVDVKVFADKAKNAAKYTGKGLKVLVEGKLKTGAYDDSQGIRRKYAEVIADRIEYLEKKKDND